MAGGKRKARRAPEVVAGVSHGDGAVEPTCAGVGLAEIAVQPVADVTVYPAREVDAPAATSAPIPVATALPEALASLAAAPGTPVKAKDEVLWLTPYRSPDEACGRPTGEPLTSAERADVIARLRLMGSGNAVRPEIIGEIQRRQRGYLVVIRQQQFAVVGW